MEYTNIKASIDALYNLEYYYCISNPVFWDGGFAKDTSLQDKSNFYTLATVFSEITKKIIKSFDNQAIIGKNFCENKKLTEDWSDLSSYDSYNNLFSIIKKSKNYKLALPDDDIIIDYIIENNFRYLTNISLFLPKDEIVIQPTCHTEINIYSKNYPKIIPIIEDILSDYNGFDLKKIY